MALINYGREQESLGQSAIAVAIVQTNVVCRSNRFYLHHSMQILLTHYIPLSSFDDGPYESN